MKLATFEVPGRPEPLSGLVRDDRVVAFGGPDGVREALATGKAPDRSLGEWPLADVRLLAPIPHPGTIYAIGLNYAEHIRGDRWHAARAADRVRQGGGVGGAAGRPDPLPGGGPAPGLRGRADDRDGRGGAIGGYCVADDVTARDLQGREPQWTRAKGADTFCPYGPWVTTADEVPDPGDLRLRTWVNDELRQDSRTSDLIFGCQELVEFISQTCTLQPGDLILTGTPNGVGMALDPPQFLRSGDRVRIAIEGLGEIRHAVE